MDTELGLAAGYIETFAGNGKARSTGDGKRAVKAGIPLPHHVALDKEEKWLYFAESGSDRIRRINLQEGTLHNFAGIGETCYSGDEGPCSEAGLYLPLDVAFDSLNNLYICDSGSNRIRKGRSPAHGLLRMMRANSPWSPVISWSSQAMRLESISATITDGSCRSVQTGWICRCIWTMESLRWRRASMTSSGLRSAARATCISSIRVATVCERSIRAPD
ncbi:MAG: hypothetical protein HY038_07820 [Nitrospirae bacterium]|nr:hypothetical protein [Nitrospirota bacterium]